MIFDAILSIMLGAAIPTLLAVGGGVLAARTLPPERKQERRGWIAFFVLSFFIAIALAAVQQVRLTAQERQDQAAAAQKEKILGQQNKYTQGQLDLIKSALQAVESSDNKGDSEKTLLSALLHSLKTPGSSASFDPHSMTNNQLRAKALSLADELQSLTKQFTAEKYALLATRHEAGAAPYGDSSENLESEQMTKWQAIRPEVQLLLAELRARVPQTRLPVQADREEQDEVNETVNDGALAGPDPLSWVSGYIRKLAYLLPTKSKD